ncbi:MAG: purine-nucleoside phosphorylase [Acidobacteria bacterium]|nr:purine-nucleoside phosphorylase [Acidobacteriota bacterium]
MSFEQVEEAHRFLAGRLPIHPAVGVVLGSGLDGLAVELSERVEIPYEGIPHWPRSTVVGHSGRLAVGRLGETTVAALAGRAHLYEGYSAAEVAFPIRVLGLIGVQAVVLTNAAGAINLSFRPGQLVLIADHINLQGTNPLLGESDERFGPRFPDMSEVYPARLRALAGACGRELGLELAEGVYAALPGPSFETPAEIRWLRAIGADMVGMSTVPEAIAAAQMGVPVLGVSSISNMAAGILPQKLSHEEVLAVGRQVRDTLTALLQKVIPRL